MAYQSVSFFMAHSSFIAVDLGAGSGRVFLVGFESKGLRLDETRRFHYPASRITGRLRWDIHRIFEEIKTGACDAGELARTQNRPIQSIGVDSWGVDYGLIDHAGQLVELPIAYRDERTAGIMEEVFSRVPRSEIFQKTGIQFLAFNTLFQLYAHVKEGLPSNAARLLMIPDLINFLLTGRVVTEFTNATTTQMINAMEGKWDIELIEALSLPASLLSEIVPAGTNLGPIFALLGADINLPGLNVVAPATHDTGSAIGGAPLREGWAYVSSGTWSLVGVELSRPLINEEVARHNFTNEGGAYGTTRFLKNVAGLWILESCRSEWIRSGLDVDYDSLLGNAAAIDEFPAVIFPDDPRFFNPRSMLEAIASQLAETGQIVTQDPATLTKVILDSLAFRYASVVRLIESLTERRIEGIHIVGGGCINEYLNRATAAAAGRPVLAGPAEATVIGNALIQAVASGRFSSFSEARDYVAANVSLKEFAPEPSPHFERAQRRYEEIEASFLE